MTPLQKQNNYQQAFVKALEVVRGRSDEELVELGSRRFEGRRYSLSVLNDVFMIDLAEGTVGLADGRADAAAGSLRMEWQVLALHYLAAPVPWIVGSSWVSFGDMREARGYDPVYRGRVLGRLCATAGRDREGFVRAAGGLGGEPADMGDEGFKFQVFPRLAVVIVWYAGDEEFEPGSSFLYPSNIMSFLSVEDVVVLSERLVGRLQGK